MGKYGLPYMGSKSGICDDLVSLFPKATHFYDIFGGGFSVTHAMLARRPRDFSCFHFNEIRPGICELIQHAIEGKYSYDVFKPQFVSREEFSKRKEIDPYIKICWSFGNNGRTYMFSAKIEPYKRSMHNAIVFNEFDPLAKEVFGMERFREGYSIEDRRLFLISKIETFRKTKIPDVLKQFLDEKKLVQLQQLEELQQLQRPQRLKQLQQLQDLQQLQQLERLQRLKRLQRLEQLRYTSLSFEKVTVEKDAIIYCDPPYQGVTEYDKNANFNHGTFLDWADAQREPVFISEYEIKNTRFKKLFAIKKQSLMSSKNRTNMIENIYGNRAAVEKVWNEAGKQRLTTT